MTPEQLKASILQYAFQGKLVEQNIEEGNGKELYSSIKLNKEKLIKEKKIKKDKPLDEITEDEIPFDIPDNWTWVRVGDMGSWASGATPSRTNPDFYGGNIPWLKTGDLNDGYIDDVPEYITEIALEKTSVRLNPKGSVLMAMYGATIGKLGILNTPMTTNQACCACITFDGVFNRYLFYFLMSQRPSYIGMAEGGAQPNISKEKIVASIMPLPPLAEQHRIVAKIEELLPFVDRYAASYEKLEQFNAKFPEDMKKSILQYAIQGKLVEQRPEEGTAEELYNQICIDRENKIKAKLIKRDKRASLDDMEEEKPFDIPENWKWVTLGSILLKLTDGTHKTPKYSEQGIKFVSVKDMSSGVLSLDNTKFITEEEHKELYNRCDPQKGDMLLSKVGTTGVPAIIDTDEQFSLFVSVALLKYNHEYINEKYLYYLLLSPLVQKQASENTRGVGNKNWVLDAIGKTLITLPPYKEQERIVEELEKLLPYCDQLIK